MRFREGDSLLAMGVIDRVGRADLFVVTEGGYAKRAPPSPALPPPRARRTGVKVITLVEARGDPGRGAGDAPRDEVLCIMASGKVVRSAVAGSHAPGAPRRGGMTFISDDGDRIAVARSTERASSGRPAAEGQGCVSTRIPAAEENPPGSAMTVCQHRCAG